MTTKDIRISTVLIYVFTLRVLCEVSCLQSHKERNYIEEIHQDDNYNVNDLFLENSSFVDSDISPSTGPFAVKEYIPEIDQFSPNCTDFSLGFCIEVQNYPMEYIKTKMKSIPEYNSYFATIERKVTARRKPGYAYRTSVTIWDVGEPLCQSTSKSVFLKAAKNTENNWRFVVNQENLTQAVRVETCMRGGEDCQMAEFFPEGYRSECRQEFSPRMLLAVNNEGVIMRDVFNIPSCCKCVLYRK